MTYSCYQTDGLTSGKFCVFKTARLCKFCAVLCICYCALGGDVCFCVLTECGRPAMTSAVELNDEEDT